MDDRVNPIRITDKDTGEVYELDFNRESVRFMATQEFTVDESIINFVATKGEELWYYAFRANHRKLARNQTDKLYEKMGGLTPQIIKRLVDLYNQALMSNNIIQDEDDLKENPHVAVEL